jgi:hypothetical protein
MEDLVFKFLTPALTWVLRAFFYLREKFATAGAPGITFVVRSHVRPDNAKFKCKILVDIKNETIPEQPVRLSAAYFVFNKSSPLKPDPKWSREYKTGRFHLYFLSPKTGQHDWRDAYLRPGQATRIHGLQLILGTKTMISRRQPERRILGDSTFE